MVGRKRTIRRFQEWVASLGSEGMKEVLDIIAKHTNDKPFEYESMLLFEGLLVATTRESPLPMNLPEAFT